MTGPPSVGASRRSQLTVAACGLILATFVFTVYAHVFADGLCCADDSSIAVAAKNLGEGHGYATSVPFYGGGGLSRFDPALSTGPTLVLPAAGVIAVVGATPWAPGFTTATVSLAVLGAIWWLMRREHGSVPALVYVTTVVGLLYVLTPDAIFIQWYSLLGEIPAALLGIAGILLITRGPFQRVTVAVGSLLLGLAVLAKILVVLAFVPAAIWWLHGLVRAPALTVRARLELVGAACAGAVPILGFEMWKLVSLGPSGYAQNVRDFIDFFRRTSGTESATSEGGLGHIRGRSADNFSALVDNFGWTPVVFCGVMVAFTVIVLRADRLNPGLRRFAALLSAGGASLGAYFLFFSVGIPRYALMALFFWGAALPCALLANGFDRGRWIRLAGAAAIAAVAVPSVSEPVEFAVADGFRPTERLHNLELTVDFLVELDGEREFVGGWWATVVDLEYLLPTVDNFTPVEEVTPEVEAAGPLLVRNQIWVDFGPSALFDEWAQRCDVELFRAEPFIVSQCPAGSDH